MMPKFKNSSEFYLSHYFYTIIDNRQELNKTCDMLDHYEIKRDDLIKQNESEVDSTTEDTPVKRDKVVV